jgi:hypothetical protein
MTAAVIGHLSGGQIGAWPEAGHAAALGLKRVNGTDLMAAPARVEGVIGRAALHHAG